MPWYRFRCKRGCTARTPWREFLVRYQLKLPRPAAKRSCSRTRSGDSDGCNQIRPRDGHRLHNLPTESETYRMATGDSKMAEQPDTIVCKLRHRVSVLRLAAPTSAAAIKGDRCKAL